jgi:hypothetical protein
MNKTHRNTVRDHMVSSLREKLSAQGIMLTEETLEFTAERYAAMIISNPELSASALIEEDITKVKELLDLIKKGRCL